MNNIFDIQFKDKFIRSMFINWYYLRLDSIALFKTVGDPSKFSFKPNYEIENPKENHDLLYQFQCLLTSTDAKRRIMRGEVDQRYGVMQTSEGQFIEKQKIDRESIAAKLETQVDEVADILKEMPMPEDTRDLTLIWSLINHESMHQGQIIVMFREAGVEFPGEFAEKWGL